MTQEPVAEYNVEETSRSYEVKCSGLDAISRYYENDETDTSNLSPEEECISERMFDSAEIINRSPDRVHARMSDEAGEHIIESKGIEEGLLVKGLKLTDEEWHVLGLSGIDTSKISFDMLLMTKDAKVPDTLFQDPEESKKVRVSRLKFFSQVAVQLLGQEAKDVPYHPLRDLVEGHEKSLKIAKENRRKIQENLPTFDFLERYETRMAEIQAEVDDISELEDHTEYIAIKNVLDTINAAYQLHQKMGNVITVAEDALRSSYLNTEEVVYPQIDSFRDDIKQKIEKKGHARVCFNLAHGMSGQSFEKDRITYLADGSGRDEKTILDEDGELIENNLWDLYLNDYENEIELQFLVNLEEASITFKGSDLYDDDNEDNTTAMNQWKVDFDSTLELQEFLGDLFDESETLVDDDGNPRFSISNKRNFDDNPWRLFRAIGTLDEINQFVVDEIGADVILGANCNPIAYGDLEDVYRRVPILPKNIRPGTSYYSNATFFSMPGNKPDKQDQRKPGRFNLQMNNHTIRAGSDENGLTFYDVRHPRVKEGDDITIEKSHIKTIYVDP